MDDWHLEMIPTRNQRTIAAPTVVEGIGYWSGQDVRVEFRGAEIDSGIVFVRSDLPGRPRIAATIANRTEAPLRTTLRAGGQAEQGPGVDMIEHVMAALAGLQIDNCEVWVDQPEMPGCDGSSLQFVEALLAAGTMEQCAVRAQKVVRQVIRRGDARCWIEARPCCQDSTILQYELDYGREGPIGQQTLEVTLSPELFRYSLAPSRTFLLEREAAALQAQGLGQRATCQDLLVFGPDGPIDNELRFGDECVRHKVLDIVGDLALAGCDVIGRIVAYRSGHRLNAELVRTILAEDEVHRELRRCA